MKENQTLIVLIKLFGNQTYNIGLTTMKESILKNHYSVILNQINLSNGQEQISIFEINENDIFVIEEAILKDYIKYLKGMGNISLKDILKIDSIELSELKTLKEYRLMKHKEA